MLTLENLKERILFPVARENKKSIVFDVHGQSLKIAISEVTKKIKHGGLPYKSSAVTIYVNGEYWERVSDSYTGNEYFNAIERALTQITMYSAMGAF